MMVFAVWRLCGARMKAGDMGLCLLCVALGSSGQVLLRAASTAAQASPTPGLRAWLTTTSISAVIVYAVGMVLWTWVLSRVPLTQAFAFFGLSFFTVPLMAHFVLGDPVGSNTWLGGAVICCGIVIAAWPVNQ